MRVGENTTLNTVRDSINKSRLKMNDLQKEQSSLKRINTPSDDPIGTSKLMTIRNEVLDNEQYEKNANLAKTFLNYTDASLEEITNLVVRAKELALGQASSAANGPESRLMVAEEIKNIQQQVASISNRRLGDRFIFAGYKTNTQPFDQEGNFKGDEGQIMVEVQKDMFVGMNMAAKDIFMGKPTEKKMNDGETHLDRNLTSEMEAANDPDENIFRVLNSLRVGLMTSDVDQIRNTLEPLEKIQDRVITARAQLGARVTGIENAIGNMSKKNLFNAELQSNIEDADIIQVVSDMAREESVLRASLQSANKLIQPTLLEFLR